MLHSNRIKRLMTNLRSVELKAFVPARDFAASLAFYRALGFAVNWEDGNLAYLHHDQCSFLLQNFYVRELAENLMLHLLVEDVDSWWSQLQADGFFDRHPVAQGLQDQPWSMRDFVLLDPSGVLWRIGQNLD
ncbi:Glyoxalase-like domain-containing protein [Andreprevotia lacus DSM 23236]|uniref:Glyoxalase-like domain-containing protein n=2 Tax=Andreprevotia TaxID=397275 RepID=A0A1W1XNG4_9NEIS|nr:Glyoxalase-like domain-containing protein [Andreprevotia lacus DSM 23236]